MWRTPLAAIAVMTCWACSAVIAEEVDVAIGVLTCTLSEPGFFSVMMPSDISRHASRWIE